jgi:hypothetical protein
MNSSPAPPKRRGSASSAGGGRLRGLLIISAGFKFQLTARAAELAAQDIRVCGCVAACVAVGVRTRSVPPVGDVAILTVSVRGQVRAVRGTPSESG